MTTLLVVGEEANIRLLFKDEFQNEGYSVTVAETTAEAIEKIQLSKPDIIALDIKIPGTEGLEFLRRIKAEGSGIPVVLCSAYASYKNDFRARSCDAFVVQSADLAELKAIIRRVLRYKQPGLALNH